MARVKFGSIVSDVSGSVGSATFQKSLYGNTLRNKPRNSREPSVSQKQVRTIMMACQYGWQSLTADQRQLWDRFIAFSGQSIKRDRTVLTSGHSLYLKYNFIRYQTFGSLLSVPIFIAMPVFPILTGLSISAGELLISFTANYATNNGFPFIKLSNPRKPSLSFSPSGLRFMPTTYHDAISYYLSASYRSAFGALPVAGQTLHYSLINFSTQSPLIAAEQKGIIVIT
jgi:hypothetical protein